MNAFPQYRDVNLEILNKPAAMYAGAAGATRLSDDLLTAEAMRTRSVGMSNAAGMLETVKENIRKNKKTLFPYRGHPDLPVLCLGYRVRQKGNRQQFLGRNGHHANHKTRQVITRVVLLLLPTRTRFNLGPSNNKPG